MGPDTDRARQTRRYERRVLDPATWAQFGGEGFYDVGWWGPGVATQRAASEALVDRLLLDLPRTPDRVLDVGCGTGASTARARSTLHARGALGVDVAPGLLQVARRRHPACSFALMDGAALALADRSVDVVTCVEAAFHVRSRRRLIDEIHRVLRPGGWFVAADLLVGDRSLLGEWMAPVENTVRPEDNAGLLTEAGLDDVRVEDATDTCWRAFCAHAARTAGTPELAAYFTALAERGASAYLLVSARRGTASDAAPRRPTTGGPPDRR